MYMTSSLFELRRLINSGVGRSRTWVDEIRSYKVSNQVNDFTHSMLRGVGDEKAVRLDTITPCTAPVPFTYGVIETSRLETIVVALSGTAASALSATSKKFGWEKSHLDQRSSTHCTRPRKLYRGHRGSRNISRACRHVRMQIPSGHQPHR